MNAGILRTFSSGALAAFAAVALGLGCGSQNLDPPEPYLIELMGGWEEPGYVSTQAKGQAEGLVQQAAQSERLEEVTSLLYRAIRTDPTSEAAHALLSDVYLRTGTNSEEGLRLLARAIWLNPGNQDYRWALADRLSSTGECEWVAPLTQPLFGGRYGPDAHKFMARCAWAGFDNDAALEHWNSAVRISPDRVDLLVGAGKARMQAGDSEGAVEVLERAANLDPNAKDIRYRLSLALRTMGRSEEADMELAIFKARVRADERCEPLGHAIILDPANPVAYEEQGKCFLDYSQWEQAFNRYSEAALLRKSTALHNGVLAYCLLKLGRETEAASFLDKAIARNPDNGMSALALAIAAERAGDNEEALSLYRLAREADQPEARLGEIRLLLEADRIGDAEAAARAWADREPEAAERAMASVAAKKGDVEEAIQRYTQAGELDYLDTGLLLEFSEYLDRVERRQEATGILRRLQRITRDPALSARIADRTAN